MGHVTVIASTLMTNKIWTFFPHELSYIGENSAQQQIMRNSSAVLPHIFLNLHSKQRFKL